MHYSEIPICVNFKLDLIKVTIHIFYLIGICLNSLPFCRSMLHGAKNISIHAVHEYKPTLVGTGPHLHHTQFDCRRRRVNIYMVNPFDLTLHRCRVVCWDFYEHCSPHCESVIGCFCNAERKGSMYI